MSILGIGVDVVHFPRIVALSRKYSPTRLATRILSSTELALWKAFPSTEDVRAERFLAVR